MSRGARNEDEASHAGHEARYLAFRRRILEWQAGIPTLPAPPTLRPTPSPRTPYPRAPPPQPAQPAYRSRAIRQHPALSALQRIPRPRFIEAPATRERPPLPERTASLSPALAPPSQQNWPESVIDISDDEPAPPQPVVPIGAAPPAPSPQSSPPKQGGSVIDISSDDEPTEEAETDEIPETLPLVPPPSRNPTTPPPEEPCPGLQRRLYQPPRSGILEPHPAASPLPYI